MKGFTLIELLAVIVILAIIILIAMPMINDVITSAKVSSVVSSNKMVMKGLENYLVVNASLLPQNTGDTVEIALQDLIDQKYISAIKSPYKDGDCSGYILITKTVDGLSKTPHINCSEDISSSTGSHHNLHYKFDDFQEPTINVSINDGQGGISPLAGDGLPPLSVIDSEVKFRGRKVARYTTGTSGNLYINGGSKISTAIQSTSWTSTIYIKRVDNTPLTNAGTYIYVTNNANDNTTIAVQAVEDGWYKVERTRSGLVAGNPTLFGLYGLGSGREYYIADWMIEPKAYVTSYVQGTRVGSITNYTTHLVSSTLDLTTTPKWTTDSVRKGVYNFSKGTDNISALGALNNVFASQKYSWGAWIKLDSSFNASGRILMSQTNVLELSINSSRRVSATTRDNFAYNTTPLSEQLELNQWYHVFATCDGSITKLYINGKLISQVSHSAFHNPSNNIYIGNWSSNQVFKGMIDEVRVYSRTLSLEEVQLIYELSK